MKASEEFGNIWGVLTVDQRAQHDEAFQRLHEYLLRIEALFEGDSFKVINANLYESIQVFNAVILKLKYKQDDSKGKP